MSFVCAKMRFGERYAHLVRMRFRRLKVAFLSLFTGAPYAELRA